MRIRILNSDGLNIFKNYINSLKSNKETIFPDLNIPDYSYEYEKEVNIIEDKCFATRLEIAEYLSEIFKKNNITKSEIVEHGKAGLWTWIAYLWFDQLTGNKKHIKRIERYICSQSWNRYYVHLVLGTYYIYESLGKERAKLFLSTPPYVISDLNDHLACYQYIVNYPNIVDVAMKLYWDEKSNSVKRGIGNKNKPGNLRRFPIFIRQLQLNYDLFTMPVDEIIKILPEEFKYWLNDN